MPVERHRRCCVVRYRPNVSARASIASEAVESSRSCGTSFRSRPGRRRCQRPAVFTERWNPPMGREHRVRAGGQLAWSLRQQLRALVRDDPASSWSSTNDALAGHRRRGRSGRQHAIPTCLRRRQQPHRTVKTAVSCSSRAPKVSVSLEPARGPGEYQQFGMGQVPARRAGVLLCLLSAAVNPPDAPARNPAADSRPHEPACSRPALDLRRQGSSISPADAVATARRRYRSDPRYLLRLGRPVAGFNKTASALCLDGPHTMSASAVMSRSRSWAAK